MAPSEALARSSLSTTFMASAAKFSRSMPRSTTWVGYRGVQGAGANIGDRRGRVKVGLHPRCLVTSASGAPTGVFSLALHTYSLGEEEGGGG